MVKNRASRTYSIGLEELVEYLHRRRIACLDIRHLEDEYARLFAARHVRGMASMHAIKFETAKPF